MLSYRSKAKERLSGIYKAQTKIASTEAKGGMTLKRTGKMPGKK